MRLVKFRVENYRRIEATDWIEVDTVTALVGGNESGKTSLLQALWKLKPGRENIQLDAQDEFPRRKYAKEYSRGNKKWPVVTAVFEIDNELHEQLSALHPAFGKCREVHCTSYYEHSPSVELLPAVKFHQLGVDEIREIVKHTGQLIQDADYSQFAIEPIKVQAASEDGEQPEVWKEPNEIIQEFIDAAGAVVGQTIGQLSSEAPTDALVKLLSSFRKQLKAQFPLEWQTSTWAAADRQIEALINRPDVDKLMSQAQELAWSAVPVFIYFDDYNLLQTKIYIRTAIQLIASGSTEPSVRSQWALFELAGFPVEEISRLRYQVDPQQQITDDAVEAVFKEIGKRAIMASSAAHSITEEFADWWHQHRHQIDFRVDGETFQIWVSDDRYYSPIEFEGRSKGFRWFFTFYLVFTAETDYAHKNAVLLLDEPGLHLYIPAQEELLRLFNELSENNQVIYSTHSPFMLDSRHLERIRVVEEMKDGLVKVSTETGRSGDEVVFPVQAHLGYKLAQTLFLSRRVLIVEGETDYRFLIFLSDYLKQIGRVGIPEQMAISFAGGNSSVRPLTAMMAPQGFEIVILLDNDPSGRSAGNTLEEQGYTRFPNVELRYYGDILGEPDPFDLESMLPSDIYRKSIEESHGIVIPVEIKASKKQTLSSAIKDYMKGQNLEFDKRVAMQWLIDYWSDEGIVLPDIVLDHAEKLFQSVHEVIFAMIDK